MLHLTLLFLFDGKNLDEWVQNNDGSPAKWDVKGDVLTVNKNYGNIETKKKFTNYQLHIEWREPTSLEGTGQAGATAVVFLASIGKGAMVTNYRYFDSYNNKTYVNAWLAVSTNRLSHWLIPAAKTANGRFMM